jgi:hypothetical protein
MDLADQNKNRSGVIRMKWIEIISIRSAEANNELLINELLKPFNQGDKINGLTCKKIYRNSLIYTDVSIHIHWKTKIVELQGSFIGNHLSKVLEEYGLVNHSIWLEEKGRISV